jgi:hypothetical protein
MGLEIDEVGIGATDLEHLVRGGGQGGDVRVDDLDRSARADRKPFQPCGGVVPSQTSSLAETSKRLNSMRGLRYSPELNIGGSEKGTPQIVGDPSGPTWPSEREGQPP